MIVVLALAALLFLARLGDRALWSEEVRWAEIPREMQQNSDYLWPTLNGKTYYDKPLGSYWLVLLASTITGEVDETSARLPSAICGLLAVAFAMLIARRFYGDDAAIMSGIVLATSFSFVFFSRNASTDVETIAGVLATLWIFLRKEAQRPGWWILLPWLVMAVTSLMKGLLGFVLPILIMGLYSSIARREWRTAHTTVSRRPQTLIADFCDRNRWFFNRWSLVAIPLSLTIYLGPFLISSVMRGSLDGLEMVYRENIRRFFDPVNHRGPVYLYTYIIFSLLAPWSLLLPAAVVHAHVADEKGSRGRAFALAYFWGTFLFFTLSSSRRSYYLLPILPAGAFLIARLLASPPSASRVTRIMLLSGFTAISLVTLLSILAFLPIFSLLPEPWNHLPGIPFPGAFLCIWIVAMLGVIFAWLKRTPRRIACAFSTIAISFMAYFYLFALPATEIYRTQRPFANVVRQTIGPTNDRLALYRTREIVYYLNASTPITECHTPDELAHGIQERGLRYVLLRRRDWRSLELDGRVLLQEPSPAWESASVAENKLILVEVSRSSD